VEGLLLVDPYHRVGQATAESQVGVGSSLVGDMLTGGHSNSDI